MDIFNDSKLIRAILQEGLASQNFSEKALVLANLDHRESGHLSWWPQSDSMIHGISVPECSSGISGDTYPGSYGYVAGAVPAISIPYFEYESHPNRIRAHGKK